MSPVAVVDRVARTIACRAAPSVALDRAPPPLKPGLFVGVADWPHIGEMFAARSLSILASGGIAAWHQAGGCCTYDGRLGFGAVSSPALEIVNGLAETSGGFLWTDDAGATWAARFADDEGDYAADRMAFAVSYRGCAWVLDGRRRSPILQTLKAQVARCSRSSRSWDDADRTRFGGLTRALWRLRLVDGAEQILGHLQKRFEGERTDQIFLTATEVGAVLNPAHGERRPNPTIDEMDAMLRATVSFQIARLRLGRLGWDPRFLCQSTVVTEMEPIGDQSFRIRTSPWLTEITAAFSEASSARHSGQPFGASIRLGENLVVPTCRARLMA